MSSMKKVIDGFGTVKNGLESELAEKQVLLNRQRDQLLQYEDALMRVESVGKRRANLRSVEAEVSAEEANILKYIDHLRQSVESERE